MLIRCGQAADAEPVVGLWRAAADVLPSATDDVPAVQALLARDADALLVGEIDGRIMATVIAGWDGWRGNLYRLAVDPVHRRTGVASELVRDAERGLSARGCRRIAASVQVDEHHAVGFWTAVGYTLDGRAHRYVKNLT